MELKKGDVVMLKSGGPRMTIKEINGNDVVCEWFVKDKHNYSSFDAETIMKPKPAISSVRIVPRFTSGL